MTVDFEVAQLLPAPTRRSTSARTRTTSGCAAHGPVWQHPRGVVFVTGYDEAISIYHDPQTWSNCNTTSGPFVKMSVPLEGDDISPIIEAHRDELPFSDQLPSFDPPQHTAHRGLLMRLITPKRLKENEAFLWAFADQTMDEFLDRGECELIQDYAIPYTVMVVADLLGVPDEDRDEFRERLAHEDAARASSSTSRSSSCTSSSRVTSRIGARTRATTS